MNSSRIKITLLGVTPPVWRRVEVASAITLDYLHQVVQAAMGWRDAHPHLFIVKDAEYGVANPAFGGSIRDERRAVLDQVVCEGDSLIYVYDFGDDWNHELTIERVTPADPAASLPRCLAVSLARAPARPRIAAARRVTRASSKRSPIPNTKTPRTFATGQARTSTPKPSIPPPSAPS